MGNSPKFLTSHPFDNSPDDKKFKNLKYFIKQDHSLVAQQSKKEKFLLKPYLSLSDQKKDVINSDYSN